MLHVSRNKRFNYHVSRGYYVSVIYFVIEITNVTSNAMSATGVLMIAYEAVE